MQELARDDSPAKIKSNVKLHSDRMSDQIDVSIIEHDFHLERRMLREKWSELRYDVQPGKRDCGADAQLTERLAFALRVVASASSASSTMRLARS